jgi:hypothetical protein
MAIRSQEIGHGSSRRKYCARCETYFGPLLFRAQHLNDAVQILRNAKSGYDYRYLMGGQQWPEGLVFLTAIRTLSNGENDHGTYGGKALHFEGHKLIVDFCSMPHVGQQYCRTSRRVGAF